MDQRPRSERPPPLTPSSGVDSSSTRSRMTTKAVRGRKRADCRRRQMLCGAACSLPPSLWLGDTDGGCSAGGSSLTVKLWLAQEPEADELLSNSPFALLV